MELENNKVVLTVNLNGGSYFDFHFKDLPLNPINFRAKDPGQPEAGVTYCVLIAEDRLLTPKKQTASHTMERLIARFGK